MEVNVNLRKLSSKTLLSYEKRRRQQDASWEELNWEDVELLTDEYKPELDTHIRIVNDLNFAWKEMFEAQRRLEHMFCDVRLATADGFINMHMPFLKGLSPFLDTLLYQGDRKTCQCSCREEMLVIMLPDVRLEHLKAFVNLLYNGKGLIHQNDEEHIQDIKKMLRIDGKMKLPQRGEPLEPGKRRPKSVKIHRQAESVPEENAPASTPSTSQSRSHPVTAETRGVPLVPPGPPSSVDSVSVSQDAPLKMPDMLKVRSGTYLNSKRAERIQRPKMNHSDPNSSSARQQGASSSASSTAEASRNEPTAGSSSRSETANPYLPPNFIKIPPGSNINFHNQPRIIRETLAPPGTPPRNSRKNDSTSSNLSNNGAGADEGSDPESTAPVQTRTRTPVYERDDEFLPSTEDVSAPVEEEEDDDDDEDEDDDINEVSSDESIRVGRPRTRQRSSRVSGSRSGSENGKNRRYPKRKRISNAKANDADVTSPDPETRPLRKSSRRTRRSGDTNSPQKDRSVSVDPSHVCAFCKESYESLQELKTHLDNSCAKRLVGLYDLEKRYCETCKDHFLNQYDAAEFLEHVDVCACAAKPKPQRKKTSRDARDSAPPTTESANVANQNRPGPSTPSKSKQQLKKSSRDARSSSSAPIDTEPETFGSASTDTNLPGPSGTSKASAVKKEVDKPELVDPDTIKVVECSVNVDQFSDEILMKAMSHLLQKKPLNFVRPKLPKDQIYVFSETELEERRAITPSEPEPVPSTSKSSSGELMPPPPSKSPAATQITQPVQNSSGNHHPLQGSRVSGPSPRRRGRGKRRMSRRKGLRGKRKLQDSVNALREALACPASKKHRGSETATVPSNTSNVNEEPPVVNSNVNVPPPPKHPTVAPELTRLQTTAEKLRNALKLKLQPSLPQLQKDQSRPNNNLRNESSTNKLASVGGQSQAKESDKRNESQSQLTSSITLGPPAATVVVDPAGSGSSQQPSSNASTSQQLGQGSGSVDPPRSGSSESSLSLVESARNGTDQQKESTNPAGSSSQNVLMPTVPLSSGVSAPQQSPPPPANTTAKQGTNSAAQQPTQLSGQLATVSPANGSQSQNPFLIPTSARPSAILPPPVIQPDVSLITLPHNGNQQQSRAPSASPPAVRPTTPQKQVQGQGTETHNSSAVQSNSAAQANKPNQEVAIPGSVLEIRRFDSTSRGQPTAVIAPSSSTQSSTTGSAAGQSNRNPEHQQQLPGTALVVAASVPVQAPQFQIPVSNTSHQLSSSTSIVRPPNSQLIRTPVFSVPHSQITTSQVASASLSSSRVGPVRTVFPPQTLQQSSMQQVANPTVQVQNQIQLRAVFSAGQPRPSINHQFHPPPPYQGNNFFPQPQPTQVALAVSRNPSSPIPQGSGGMVYQENNAIRSIPPPSRSTAMYMGAFPLPVSQNQIQNVATTGSYPAIGTGTVTNLANNRMITTQAYQYQPAAPVINSRPLAIMEGSHQTPPTSSQNFQGYNTFSVPNNNTNALMQGSYQMQQQQQAAPSILSAGPIIVSSTSLQHQQNNNVVQPPPSSSAKTTESEKRRCNACKLLFSTEASYQDHLDDGFCG